MKYILYQYNDKNYRIVVDKCLHTSRKFINNDDTDKDYDEIQRISLSRSKRMIREYSLCNDFTYFFTATVNAERCDRYSLEDTQEKIRYICERIKRVNKDFKYLFITEKHKDGAYHFHGLCTDLDLYDNSNNYLSNTEFDKLGYNSFSAICDKTKVSNYITKYITKDCIKNEKGSVYFCSKGLKKAEKYNIMPLELDDYLEQNPYENDYCKIYDINLEKLNAKELLFLIDKLKTI